MGMVIIIIEVTIAEITTRVIVLREEWITEATPRTAIQILGVVVVVVVAETIAIDLIAAEIAITIIILRDTIVIIVAEIIEKEEDIPNEEIHEMIVRIVIPERNIKRKTKKKKIN